MDFNDSGKIFLLLDAAGPLVQTGLWRNGQWIRWIGSGEEAGKSLFQGVERIFAEEGTSIDRIDGFFFCTGPGSMLGLRIAAMAIRGWQSLRPQPLPIYGYSSHRLLAHMLLANGKTPPFHVISDARRDSWHVTTVLEPGVGSALRRLPSDELAELTGPFYRMEERVRAEPPVKVAAILPYHLEKEAARFLEPGLLHPMTDADPSVLEAPEYKKWSAERHRG